MSKFLVQGSYTPEGLTGLLQEGGTSRRAAAEQAVESVGGRLESFYFAFGSADFFVIADLPDQRTAAAVSMAANAGGRIHSTMVVLITPEELDEAAKTNVNFRPPGA
jgi:uncharacterized protein with GYD domain